MAAQPKSIECTHCGSSFNTYQSLRLFCSSACKRAAAGRHRRGKWISKARRDRLHKRDAWTCWICGRACDPTLDPMTDALYPTLDHQIPRSHGGDDSDGNLKTACRACNTQRGNALLVA